jgi:hypothetical protein
MLGLDTGKPISLPSPPTPNFYAVFSLLGTNVNIKIRPNLFLKLFSTSF